MNKSKCLLICIVTTLFFASIQATLPGPSTAQGPSALQGPSAPPMSNEEQALAQQLDSVFEELTKGMSESEKNKFFNELNTAMEEEIEKMSKMSDEELTKYIQDAESELKSLGPWPEQEAEKHPQQVQPPVNPEQQKTVEPVVKEEPKTPSRDMVPVIDEITARIDSFIQKTGQVANIAAKFEKWGAKGKLSGWNPTISWAVFKEKLDTLKNTLLNIKSLDPKTQKPRFLVDLAANDAICNNINQFKAVLAKHEPGVQVPSFGLKKMSEPSKAAIIAVINDCLEALLALNIQKELEKIIEKYEPTAKKIKEAEEKAQQAALEASKHRPTAPGAMKTTVRRGQEAGYYEFGVPGKQDYSPYAQQMPYQQKIEQDGKDTTHGTTPKKEDAAAGAKKDEKTGPASKKEDVKETETTKRLENTFNQFTDAIETDIPDAIGALNLQKRRAELRSKNAPTLEKITGEIKGLADQVKTASKIVSHARSSITSLEQQAQKDKWKKKFQTAWGEQRQLYMSLRNIFQQEFPIEMAEWKEASDQQVSLKNAAHTLINAIDNLNRDVENIAAKKRRLKL